MAESKLRELSMEFSVDIINLVKYLKANHESVIANQIGKSGTSIGANVKEGVFAQSRADFTLHVLNLLYFIGGNFGLTHGHMLASTIPAFL